MIVPLFFQQTLLPTNASGFRLCPGTVLHHWSSKKVTPILDWSKIPHLHKSAKSQSLTISGCSNPWTVQMGNKASRIWFWDHLQTRKRKYHDGCLNRIDKPHRLAISTTDPTWISEPRTFYTTKTGKSLLQKILQKPEGTNKFQIRDGLLYHQHRLYIHEETSIKQQLLQEYHSSPLGGHSGILRTIKRITVTFAWPKLKTYVTLFIRNYATCQQLKSPTHKSYGLLQPLPILASAWQDITMDFVTHLPLSTGKTIMWVIVDRFSKLAHFIALPTNFGAATLAALFLTNIYKLHGIPKSIVSDRDSIFLSSFWKELFK